MCVSPRILCVSVSVCNPKPNQRLIDHMYASHGAGPKGCRRRRRRRKRRIYGGRLFVCVCVKERGPEQYKRSTRRRRVRVFISPGSRRRRRRAGTKHTFP